ncbi:MAG: hypothetical protein HY897_26155 [Deltaproteobacteria bacterium]|nr:hypothetical protein [Deltaproteobacteria bacterium]
MRTDPDWRRRGIQFRSADVETLGGVTDTPGAAAGDEVVLLGKQGDDSITADQLAAMIGTINFEIVARLDPFAPRVLV